MLELTIKTIEKRNGVETIVGENEEISANEGDDVTYELAVFTNRDIPDNTIIWQGSDENEIIILNASYNSLDITSKQYIYQNCSRIGENWSCRLDITREIRQSNTPNLTYDIEARTITSNRFISRGSEVTLDYGRFDESMIEGPPNE